MWYNSIMAEDQDELDYRAAYEERKSFVFSRETMTDEAYIFIEKLLPGWERTSGDEMQDGYRIEIDDKNWRLSFDPILKV